MPLHILDIIQAWCKRIIDINNNDLPVRLTFVEQSHDAEDFDLLHLARLSDEFTDLADVERVVVALLLGLRVGNVGIFPSLGEGAVVPEIAFVWEAVADEAQLALLRVLLDWVECLILRDLCIPPCQLHVI